MAPSIARSQFRVRAGIRRLRNAEEDGNFAAMSNDNTTEFSNVTAVAKANVYFDGKVVSHTVRFADGSKKTLGLIYAGEYHFGTDAPERMDIIAGNCEVKLDGSEDWQAYVAGSSFRVPGKSGFSIAVAGGIAQYVCSFE